MPSQKLRISNATPTLLRTGFHRACMKGPMNLSEQYSCAASQLVTSCVSRQALLSQLWHRGT